MTKLSLTAVVYIQQHSEKKGLNCSLFCKKYEICIFSEVTFDFIESNRDSHFLFFPLLQILYGGERFRGWIPSDIYLFQRISQKYLEDAIVCWWSFFHQFLTIQGTNLGETVFYRNNNWMISMTVAFQQLFLHVCAHSSLQLNGGQMSFPMFAALQQCVKIFHQEKVVQHVLRNVTVHHRKHPI